MASQISIRFLLFVTLACAVVVVAAMSLTRTIFVVTTIFVPLLLGLSVRFLEKWSSISVCYIVVWSAMAIGSALTAYGSYDRTFLRKEMGFLVGDGWSSVFASAVVGGFFGTVCSLISLAFYWWIIAIWLKTAANSGIEIGESRNP